jgi:hypothetical protein
LRFGLTLVGVLVLLAGAVFAGQGLGYIPGSFMTGDIHWFWIGVALILSGLGLVLAGRLLTFKRA